MVVSKKVKKGKLQTSLYLELVQHYFYRLRLLLLGLFCYFVDFFQTFGFSVCIVLFLFGQSSHRYVYSEEGEMDSC